MDEEMLESLIAKDVEAINDQKYKLK